MCENLIEKTWFHLWSIKLMDEQKMIHVQGDIRVSKTSAEPESW